MKGNDLESIPKSEVAVPVVPPGFASPASRGAVGGPGPVGTSPRTSPSLAHYSEQPPPTQQHPTPQTQLRKALGRGEGGLLTAMCTLLCDLRWPMHLPFWCKHKPCQCLRRN